MLTSCQADTVPPSTANLPLLRVADQQFLAAQHGADRELQLLEDFVLHAFESYLKMRVDAIPQYPYNKSRNARGPDFVVRAMRAVASFTDFTKDNDPYDEHDFGAFDLDGEKLFWKIDSYEKGWDYTLAAEAPENPQTTDRVLTVMLAEEY